VRKHRNRIVTASIERLDIRRLFALAAVDINSSGTGPTDDSSFGYEVSADGNWACFVSRGFNLVSSPSANSNQQAYRRNLITGKTEMVSVDAAGNSGADHDVLRVHMSADGRYVAFSTSAVNITSGDNNVDQDTYLRDMQTGKTTLASRGYVGVLADKILGAVGGPLVAISGDGSRVVFGGVTGPDVFIDDAVDTNSSNDLFIWSRDTQKVDCVTFRNGTTTTGNGGVDSDGEWGKTQFSADGRYLLFYSRAKNYVSGVSDTTNSFDTFLFDTTNSNISYVSVNAAGTIAGNGDSAFADLSNDGRYVAFETISTNLASNDNNGFGDVLLKDRSNGSVKIVSRTAGGAVANNESTSPDITGDGLYVAYASAATNIANPDNGPGTFDDVYRFNTQTNQNILISVNTAGNGPGEDDSGAPSISDDGNYVAFQSVADDLATNATKSDSIYQQVYLRNISAGTTTLISVGSSNVSGPANSLAPVLSKDGSRLLFKSSVANLVSGDSGDTENIFTTITPGHDFATLVGGVLDVRGSYLTDTITLALKKTDVYVTRNGVTLKFKRSSISSTGINGFEGNDVITLGNGVGGAYVLGGSDNDKIFGGDGNDAINGAAGEDTIYGGIGDDRLNGGKGNDYLSGDDNIDRLYGGDGNDKLLGGGGVDRLTGDAGKDTLDGGGSNDKFYVADGVIDFLFGGNGNDSAFIDVGKDVLNSVESSTAG
jgi:Ca2+-binding RTX toxin-like protein